jgi:hypothetical protein
MKTHMDDERPIESVRKHTILYGNTRDSVQVCEQKRLPGVTWLRIPRQQVHFRDHLFIQFVKRSDYRTADERKQSAFGILKQNYEKTHRLFCMRQFANM